MPFDPYGRLGSNSTRGIYRPIGINRNNFLAVLQIRSYTPAGSRALQWMAFGSNAFNALVPLFANVNELPEYLSNTEEGHVSTENLYWASRLIAALADAQFSLNTAHIERYQLAVGSKGHALVAEADRQVAKLAYADAAARLEAANKRLAAMLRDETDRLLFNVLFTTSANMRNAFSRSDG